MTTWTPDTFIVNPCFTHLASFLTLAISCSFNGFFCFKLFACTITIWMRYRKTSHYATLDFGTLDRILTSKQFAWICSSVTLLQLWQKNWFSFLQISHFLFTSSSLPHFLHESNLIMSCTLFFDLNDMKIRWN